MSLRICSVSVHLLHIVPYSIVFRLPRDINLGACHQLHSWMVTGGAPPCSLLSPNGQNKFVFSTMSIVFERGCGTYFSGMENGSQESTTFVVQIYIPITLFPFTLVVCPNACYLHWKV